jgi:hypothetical protein
VRVPRNVAKSSLTALIMRNHLIFLGLPATTLLGIPAFSGQGPAPANEERAVRKAAAAYFEATNKGDLDGLMTCLAPDADFIDLSEPVRAGIDAKVRGAAYAMIGGKGATYYGIGSALARIVDAILHDQRAVMTVGAPAADVLGVRDVTVALPRLVGGQGVLQTFPLPLNDQESAGLRASAGLVRAALDELGDNV